MELKWMNVIQKQFRVVKKSIYKTFFLYPERAICSSLLEAQSSIDLNCDSNRIKKIPIFACSLYAFKLSRTNHHDWNLLAEESKPQYYLKFLSLSLSFFFLLFTQLSWFQVASLNNHIRQWIIPMIKKKI